MSVFFFLTFMVFGNMIVPYLFTTVMLENFFESMEDRKQEEVRRPLAPLRPRPHHMRARTACLHTKRARSAPITRAHTHNTHNTWPRHDK